MRAFEHEGRMHFTCAWITDKELKAIAEEMESNKRPEDKIGHDLPAKPATDPKAPPPLSEGLKNAISTPRPINPIIGRQVIGVRP